VKLRVLIDMLWHKKKEEALPAIENNNVQEEDLSIPELEIDESKERAAPIQESIPKTIAKPMPKPISLSQPIIKSEEMSAPLFVKLDKYKELASKVQEMRVYLGAIKQSFSILSELEIIRNDALKIVSATITKFERMVLEMDADLLKPVGVSWQDVGVKEPEVEHLDDALTDLQNQIKALRSELENLK